MSFVNPALKGGVNALVHRALALLCKVSDELPLPPFQKKGNFVILSRYLHISISMNRSASLAQIQSLSPVQRAALRLIPFFQVTFALCIVAQQNGYPIGF